MLDHKTERILIFTNPLTWLYMLGVFLIAIIWGVTKFMFEITQLSSFWFYHFKLSKLNDEKLHELLMFINKNVSVESNRLRRYVFHISKQKTKSLLTINKLINIQMSLEYYGEIKFINK